MTNRIQINEKLAKFLTTPKPLKIAIGGRNSGKSIGIADMIAIKMLNEGIDVMCLREFMGSIEDSVHKVLTQSVRDRLKLEGWDIQKNTIISPDGNYTRYIGAARNPDSVQSAENFMLSWFEEAHTASAESLEKLIPTVLRRAGAECWFSANPQSAADPFSQRFIVPFKRELDKHGYYEDDLHMIIKINWRDNPWFDETANKLRLYDKATKSKAKYEWIWEGEFDDSVEGGMIQQEWFEACVDAHKKLGFDAEGVDVVAHDPSGVGADPKTILHRHGSVIVHAEEMVTGDEFDGIEWALDYALAKNVDLFVWDGDGSGALLRDRVEQRLSPKIAFNMYRGSAKVEHPDKPFMPFAGREPGAKLLRNKDVFDRRRTQQYYSLATRIYRTYEAVKLGKYRNPDHLISFDSRIKCLDNLRSELCRLPLKDNANGKIQLMPKPEMKRMGICSPNLADACKMSLVNPTTNRHFVRPGYVSW